MAAAAVFLFFAALALRSPLWSASDTMTMPPCAEEEEEEEEADDDPLPTSLLVPLFRASSRKENPGGNPAAKEEGDDDAPPEDVEPAERKHSGAVLLSHFSHSSFPAVS